MGDLTRRDAFGLVVAAGWVGATGGVAGGAERRPEDRWRAWAVTEGEQARLVVEGIYGQGGPGLVAIVKEAAPQGFNPRILMLELKTATLPGLWPTVLLPVPASFVKAPYKADQYESVEIRYPDGYVAKVEKIIDTGKGPA